MGAKIGTGDILFRVGSGSPSKVFLGSTAVQTVPGAPALTSAAFIGPFTQAVYTAPASGGSPITGYNVYTDGTLSASNVSAGALSSGFVNDPVQTNGLQIAITAVNAIGEGPKSDPVTVT